MKALSTSATHLGVAVLRRADSAPALTPKNPLEPQLKGADSALSTAFEQTGPTAGIACVDDLKSAMPSHDAHGDPAITDAATAKPGVEESFRAAHIQVRDLARLDVRIRAAGNGTGADDKLGRAFHQCLLNHEYHEDSVNVLLKPTADGYTPEDRHEAYSLVGDFLEHILDCSRAFRSVLNSDDRSVDPANFAASATAFLERVDVMEQFFTGASAVLQSFSSEYPDQVPEDKDTLDHLSVIRDELTKLASVVRPLTASDAPDKLNAAILDCRDVPQPPADVPSGYRYTAQQRDEAYGAADALADALHVGAGELLQALGTDDTAGEKARSVLDSVKARCEGVDRAIDVLSGFAAIIPEDQAMLDKLSHLSAVIQKSIRSDGSDDLIGLLMGLARAAGTGQPKPAQDVYAPFTALKQRVADPWERDGLAGALAACMRVEEHANDAGHASLSPHGAPKSARVQAYELARTLTGELQDHATQLQAARTAGDSMKAASAATRLLHILETIDEKLVTSIWSLHSPQTSHPEDVKMRGLLVKLREEIKESFANGELKDLEAAARGLSRKYFDAVNCTAVMKGGTVAFQSIINQLASDMDSAANEHPLNAALAPLQELDVPEKMNTNSPKYHKKYDWMLNPGRTEQIYRNDFMALNQFSGKMVGHMTADFNAVYDSALKGSPKAQFLVKQFAQDWMRHLDDRLHDLERAIDFMSPEKHDWYKSMPRDHREYADKVRPHLIAGFDAYEASLQSGTLKHLHDLAKWAATDPEAFILVAKATAKAADASTTP
jgi:hypothetical protein